MELKTYAMMYGILVIAWFFEAYYYSRPDSEAKKLLKNRNKNEHKSTS